MIAIIYRGFVYPEREDEYLKLWKIIASYFVAERGALGSSLHKTDLGEYIAYSRWPDQQTRAASWGPDTEIDENAEIARAIESLKGCIDRSQPYDEIVMNVVENLLG